MSIVPRARPGGPPFAVDGRRVRIATGNGSGAEAMRGQLVSESALEYTLLYIVHHPAVEDKRLDR